MKKINKIFTVITTYILIILALAILGTFLSDYLVNINWFGDYTELRFKGKEYEYTSKCWGARHYSYNWGLFFLFLTTLARCIVSVIYTVENTK